MHHTRLVALFLAATGLAACHGELHQNPGNVELRVGLQNQLLELLNLTEVGELPNPPVDGDGVEFVFRPSDGSAAVEGLVRDSRLLRSEFDATGQPDPRQLIADWGVFDVRIPAVAGRLELRAGSGESLGHMDVDPNRPVTRKQPLLRGDDVLSAPVKILDNGSSANKVDILFLPEGYRETELDRFHTHVDSIVAQLGTQSGFRDHWDGFNVWRQDVRSRTSGTGRRGFGTDTAFETASGVSGLDRCIFFSNPAGREAARALAEAAGADATVVLVNHAESGGCASGGFVVSSRPRNVGDVVAHELGHALFGLADEYESPMPSGHCSIGPNVAFSPRLDALPWADMVNTSELPTSPNGRFGTIGAFEGAGYCAVGRFRPTHNCMMRTLGTGMCPVCRREVARTMDRLAPAPSGSGTFEVENQTGVGLWVRCDGQPTQTCSDWTFIEDMESATIDAPGGRLVLHDSDATVRGIFDNVRVTAGAPEVTIFANADDPFVPPVGGSGPEEAPLDAPRGLFPSLVTVTDPEVELRWNAVAGAATYLVAVEVEEDGVWHAFGELETPGSRALLDLGPEDARYRWKVAACDERGCSGSAQAVFTADLEPEGPRSATTTPPATPRGLSPGNESVVYGDSVALTWEAPANATTFNVVVQINDASSAWVEHESRSGLTVPRYSADLSTAGAWYAWRVQACNASRCSGWTDSALLYRNP